MSGTRSLLGASRAAPARRAQWGVVDQGVSSLTNLGISLAVAREASPRQFGIFSLALTLYVTLLWAARSVTAEPFVVRFTAAAGEEQRAAAGEAVGAALTMGGVAALVMLAVGAGGGPGTLPVLAAMAIGMPGLLTQDSYRYVLLAAGRARAATANDALWFLVQAGGVAALFAAHRATATTLALAFGGSATVAAVVAATQTGVAPVPTAGLRWARRHRDLCVPFFFEMVAVTGMVQVALLAIAATSGAPAIGALRAAMLLLGPLTVVFVGVFVAGVPEAIRLRERRPSAFPRLIPALGVVMPLIAVAWGGLLLLTPNRGGTALLGTNWAPARHVIPPVAAMTAGHGCALAGIVGLRALGMARQSLGARLWGAPVFVVGGVVGSVTGGAYGAAVGLAVAAWFDAALVWVAFRSCPTSAGGVDEHPGLTA